MQKKSECVGVGVGEEIVRVIFCCLERCGPVQKKSECVGVGVSEDTASGVGVAVRGIAGDLFCPVCTKRGSPHGTRLVATGGSCQLSETSEKTAPQHQRAGCIMRRLLQLASRCLQCLPAALPCCPAVMNDCFDARPAEEWFQVRMCFIQVS